MNENKKEIGGTESGAPIGLPQPIPVRLFEPVALVNKIDWEQFKATVAATMLPIIYRELPNSGNLVSNRQQQAVDEAAEIAERLERRLRK